MELVFEPDLSNGLEASALVKELLLIFERIKTCSGRMEGNYLTSLNFKLFITFLYYSREEFESL